MIDVMAHDALALRPAPRSRRWLGVAARVLVVVAAHTAVIIALLELDPQLREQAEPLFVDLITAPQPKVEPPVLREPAPPAPSVATAKPKPKPKPRPHPEKKIETPQAPIAAPPIAPEAPIAVEPAPVAEAPASGALPSTPEGGDQGAIGTGPPGAGTGAGAPVVAPRFDAAYLNNPRPEYPRIARRLGEQGQVLLSVFVDAAGRPEKVEIRSSSGHPRLDQAALEAVRKWRFVPARRGDRPIGAWVLVPISFVLES